MTMIFAYLTIYGLSLFIACLPIYFYSQPVWVYAPVFGIWGWHLTYWGPVSPLVRKFIRGRRLMENGLRASSLAGTVICRAVRATGSAIKGPTSEPPADLSHIIERYPPSCRQARGAHLPR